MATPGAVEPPSRSGGALAATARLVPGVANRLLEAVPRARVPLLPPRARLTFDVGPLPTPVALVAPELAAEAVRRRALLVADAGARAAGGPVATEVVIVRPLDLDV